MKLQKLLPALIPFIMLCSCNEFNEEQNSKGSVRLSYSPASSENQRMDHLKELQPSSIFISISNEQGEMVRNTEKFPLIKTGDAFITKDIELKTGNYTLEKFIVTDSMEQVIYLAPKSGSDKAAHVTNPLPIDFQVQAESASDIEVEVLPSNTGSASEFGYAAFSFEIANINNEDHDKVKCLNELNYDSSKFANDSTYKYLPGKWHMVEYDKSVYTAEPSPPIKYNKNEVIWNFKGDSDSLIISIHNGSIEFWQIEGSRTYNYKLDSGNCSDVYDNYNSLFLDGKDKGVLKLHNKDSMTLSDACRDGWRIIFEKCRSK